MYLTGLPSFFDAHDTSAELDVETVARAEIAADILRHDPHLLGLDPEHGGELGLLAHRPAAAGPQGAAAAGAVPMAEGGARLDRHPSYPRDVEFHRDDVVGSGKGAVGLRRVAEPGVDEDIVRHLVPNHRSARRQSLRHLRHPGQRRVFDRDRLRRVECLRRRLGHHHRHRLADMAHPIGRQRQLRADEDRPAAGAGQLHVVAGLRHRAVRDRGKPVGEAVLSGKDAEHPSHRRRPPGVDPHDPGMRVGRAHDRGMGLPRQAEIVAEPTRAGQQPLILLAPQRLPDGAEQRCLENADCIIHWRPPSLGGV